MIGFKFMVNIVKKIDDFVKVKNVLISVSDKTHLEQFIPALIEINSDIKIFSTGGTYKKISKIIGNKSEKNLIKVSDYTKQPETQGGLVKTLDFKIYLGLLTETYNERHQKDIKRLEAIPIDMVIVNLYPFENTVKKKTATIEEARANIDIGGPCMIRAAAKNYLRVASVTAPLDYEKIILFLQKNNGMTSLEIRFALAKKAFEHTAKYDRAIADYLSKKTSNEAMRCYLYE
jgi:phosphoribosylaminoimidazolecarboxamide formyltransferase / IMP cyclohydrolase